MRPNFCPSLRHWKPLMAQSCATKSKQASRILLIAIALAFLPALAFASPPDPSWIVGIYDGADGDDIVTLVADTAAANAPLLLQNPPPLPLSQTPLGLGSVAFQRLHPDLQPRAPPSTPIYLHCAHTLKSVTHFAPTKLTQDSLLSDRSSNPTVRCSGSVASCSTTAACDEALDLADDQQKETVHAQIAYWFRYCGIHPSRRR